MTVIRRHSASLSAPRTEPTPGEGFRDEPWMAEAVCAQTDPEIFFPDKGGHNASVAAKRVCAVCPVRPECLEYALQDARTSYMSPFHFGIYGGLSPRERRALLQQREAGVA